MIPQSFQILKSNRYSNVGIVKDVTENMGKEQILTQPFTDLEELADVDSPPSRKRRNPSSKRAGKGTSPYTTVPLPPCKVCGGVATGYHFGVITCEACKVSVLL